MLSCTLHTRAIKTSLITACFTLSAFSLNAHATLTSYTSNGADLVYSSVSDVTWTKDGNLLGTLFATQGFNTVVNQIIADSSGIIWYGTTVHFLNASDFSSNGQTSWFGAMAYVNYLNTIDYGGSELWYLPTTDNTSNTSFGYYTATNGTTKGDELVELYYQELGGTAGNYIPNTTTFINEQAYAYWSGTEYEPDPFRVALLFLSYDGSQYYNVKDGQFYAWAVSPGQIKVTPVPEPGSVALMLAGLGLVGGVVRRSRG